MMIDPMTISIFRSASWIFLCCGFCLLGGCATQTAYDPIGDADFKGPSLQAVRGGNDASAFRDARVRWGGTIARVENQRAETWVEIVQRPLQDDGRPLAADTSEGRFLARVTGFLDPAIYAQNRPLTVVGKLENSVERPIGEFPYRFPVVAAERFKLWDERQPSSQVFYFYADPFWFYYPRGRFYYHGPRRYR